MTSGVRLSGLVWAVLMARTPLPAQQHDMSRMAPPVTSGWSWRLDGSVALAYVKEGSRRGDSQVGVRDWEMVMGMRKFGAASFLTTHLMTTSARFTLTVRGVIISSTRRRAHHPT